MKQKDLEWFEEVYDIIFFLEQKMHHRRDSFCNMVLGHEMGCDKCCWVDLCEKIETDENPFEESMKRYAEYLI